MIHQFQEIIIHSGIPRNCYDSIGSPSIKIHYSISSHNSSCSAAMASGGIFTLGIRRIEIVQVRLRKPNYKPPLSRARKILREDAGYRVTDGNIAAIDFGTTSVSLAYTTKGDDEITSFKLDTEDKSTRVPNVILLKKDGRKVSVEAFGNVARSRFTLMRKNDHPNYIYFERIKMLMKREEVRLT